MTDEPKTDLEKILAAIREAKLDVRDDVAAVYAHLKQDITELKREIESLRTKNK